MSLQQPGDGVRCDRCNANGTKARPLVPFGTEYLCWFDMDKALEETGIAL